MPQPPNLLNDDGGASMATMLMMSHHAFRRDLARLFRAVERIKAGDVSRNAELQKEWSASYHAALHGHHMFEDQNIFPDIRGKHPDLAAALDTLTGQHHRIDPLLAQGDAAFADLAHPEKAEAVLRELRGLLDEHLAFEEEKITPELRESRTFPTPPDDTAAAMYAEGFAWSMQGIAPEVLAKVREMLPKILTDRLPAAEAAFEAHCKKAWGDYEVGAAATPIPTAY